MSESPFQSCQVVYLEHENVRLFAEVIQVVRSRQICWVRPLLIVTNQPQEEEHEVYDVRHTADLFWPLRLFQPALDTDFISFLGSLAHREVRPEDLQLAKQRLSNFVWKVWQTHPGEFQA